MAEAFAEKYKHLPWQAVFASPMKRTVATATPFCKAIGQNMQLRNGLKEMDFGEWEGKSTEYVQEHYQQDYIQWLTEPAWNPPTGGESGVQVASRASLVMAEIEDKFTEGKCAGGVP